MVKRVAVIGGGISGLSAAWGLLRSGNAVEVVIYESSPRVGGWIRSGRSRGGGVFEYGPRSLRATGPAARHAMELVSSVGLANQVIPRTSRDPLKKYIYTERHGLVESPSGLSWLYRRKPPFTKPLIVPVLKDLFTQGGSTDETVKEFFQRRFGNEMAKYVADPLCRGVYASSSETLSMKSCFALFHEAEQRSGSVIRGMLRQKPEPLPSSACSLVKRASAEKWSMYSLRGGLGTLPTAMHKYLLEKGVEIRLEKSCSKLDFKGGKSLVESGGQVQEYDSVVSAVSSSVLSSLLSSSHSQLAQTLESIDSVTVAVVCLEYEGSDVVPAKYRNAFGYLVPSSEASKILGVVFDSSTFPELDRSDRPSTRLSVMLGGEWFEGMFGHPDDVSKDTIKQIALAELKSQLGITREPLQAVSLIHKNCFPLYRVNHSVKLDFISQYVAEKQLPLVVTGLFYNGVSVNDCVFNSIQSSSNLLRS